MFQCHSREARLESSIHSRCRIGKPLFLQRNSQGGFVGHRHVAVPLIYTPPTPKDPPLSSGEHCRSWSVAWLGRHKKIKQFSEAIGNSSCSSYTPENDYTQHFLHAQIPGGLIYQTIHAESSNFTPRIFFSN